MKVGLSVCVEVRLVTLRWLRVGAYRDDANYIKASHGLTLKLPSNAVNV